MRKFGAAAIVFVLSAAGVATVPAVAADNPPAESTATVDQATLRSGRSFEKVRASISPDTYAGAYLDRSSGALRVMVTREPPAPALDPQLDAPVEFVLVRYPLEYLEQRMADVFAARDRIGGPGSRIRIVDVNEINNSLQVVVDGAITTELRDELARTAPDTPLELESGISRTVHDFSRVDDAAPWSSGTHIFNSTTGGRCTSGPGVRVGSTKYMLTAGHCATATGQQIYQGRTAVPTVTAELIGAVANRSGFPNLDAMLVSGNTTNTMYRTWYTKYFVSSSPWESLAGQTVCTGGAYTGETCALMVGQTNFCDTGYNSCGLTVAGRAGTTAAGEGDSGGPLYILSPGLRYSGIVKGSWSPLYYCPDYPSGIRVCSDYIVFTRIQNILGYFGASLLP